MKFLQCLSIIFMILSIVAASFLLPVAVAVYLREPATIPAFLIPMAVLWPITILLFFKTRRRPIRLTVREGILLVCFAWVGAGLLGAVPFMLSTTPCSKAFRALRRPAPVRWRISKVIRWPCAYGGRKCTGLAAWELSR